MERAHESHSKYGYQGDALANPANDFMTSREAAAVYLKCYIELYEFTGQQRWLEHAKRAASYFESTHMVQRVQLLALNTTGYEYFDNDPFRTDGKRFKEMGMLGNAQIMPFGLSYVSSQTASADMFGAYLIPYYHRLAAISGREHYTYFANYLQYNTMLYVNMEDKHWLMDDLRFSTGIGFMNEYIGIGASTDPVSAGRGTMHIGNLAWNMFVLLFAFEEMLAVNPDYLADDLNRSFDMAKFQYTRTSSDLNSIFRGHNAVTKEVDTAWVPAADDTDKYIVVDLMEFCRIENISVRGFNHGSINSLSILVSNDGINFTQIGENAAFNADGLAAVSGGGQTAMFVKVKLNGASGMGGISDINVNGLPRVLTQLQTGSTVTSNMSNAARALEWNNNTFAERNDATAGSYVTVDLGEVTDVFEVGVRFDLDVHLYSLVLINRPDIRVIYRFVIEYSLDGEEWETYADFSDNQTFTAMHIVAKHAEARFVRLRVISVDNRTNLRLRQFKIMG